MTTTTAAAMLDAARHALGREPDERVQAQIERLAEHVDAVNAFPLPDAAPPYFPQANPLPIPPDAVSPAPPLSPASATSPSGPLHTLSATAIARLVAARAVSVVDVANATLDRIAATEKSLQAWVYVDREDVLARAKKLDAMMGAAWPRGPLHGVPIGVKDIYDVAGMPTRAGSRVLADAPPAQHDSWLVARLRAAGALIVGKTATTEFAAMDPAGTRNPWNLAHTPGGSSSGSAAAVAARVVPIALGTQTAGSVIRPASFCGIVGFKPTWGRVPLDGVIPFAWSLDTAGWFARSVEDAELVWRVLTWGNSLHRESEQAPNLASVPEFYAPSNAPKRYRGPSAASAAVDVRQPLASPLGISVAAAASFRESMTKLVHLPSWRPIELSAMADVLDAQQVLMAGEASTYHGRRYVAQSALYGPRIGALVAAGLGVPATAYLQAQRLRGQIRRTLWENEPRWEFIDAIAAPSAPGGAPEGLDSTGDPSFNAPWTQFGFPAITLFGGLDAKGLPLGVQLVGWPGADGDLLATAAWCENVLGAAPAPPDYAV